MTKLLITGGRTYNNVTNLYAVLDSIMKTHFITTLITGMASGADILGHQWAEERGLEIEEYPADWKNIEVEGAVIKHGAYGRYNVIAGFQRNQRMIDEGNPNVLVAFDGGRGTADMVRRAKASDIKIIMVSG